LAGIGFELRRLLKRDTLFALLRAYGYAGIISSGPWILSMVGVMGIGILSVGIHMPEGGINQFLVSITSLMAFSLILTGPLQLMLTRFIADQHFSKKNHRVLPNLFGALLLNTSVSGAAAIIVVVLLFDGSVIYRALMVATFVVLCDVWLVFVLLSGLKEYRRVLWTFALGYGVAMVSSLLLRRRGLEGLLAGYLIGHVTLLFTMLYLVVRDYHSNARGFLSFDFLRPTQAFYSLFLIGGLYNAGIWADKFVFWWNPLTSEAILPPLRASLIYDTPIFLAYLSIIPGMAVFLVRIETDFAEYYDRFYRAVREGQTLRQLNHLREGMVFFIRQGIFEIFKVQGVTAIILVLAGPRIFVALGFSPLNLRLFTIDLVGVGVQVLMLAVLNVLFYLDERRLAAVLTGQFLVLNVGLSLLSQRLGPAFYGYGFTAATVVTSFTGLVLLSKKIGNLEYETFMLQR
jgi:polysaccharide biosynthesis protein PelG